MSPSLSETDTAAPCAFISASRFIKSCARSRYPYHDTTCRGVQLCVSHASTSEPQSSDSCATSLCPYQDAACNGMKPLSSRELMSEPRRAMSGFPVRQETWQLGEWLVIGAFENKAEVLAWVVLGHVVHCMTPTFWGTSQGFLGAVVATCF